MTGKQGEIATSKVNKALNESFNDKTPLDKDVLNKIDTKNLPLNYKSEMKIGGKTYQITFDGKNLLANDKESK